MALYSGLPVHSTLAGSSSKGATHCWQPGYPGYICFHDHLNAVQCSAVHTAVHGIISYHHKTLLSRVGQNDIVIYLVFTLLFIFTLRDAKWRKCPCKAPVLVHAKSCL